MESRSHSSLRSGLALLTALALVDLGACGRASDGAGTKFREAPEDVFPPDEEPLSLEEEVAALRAEPVVFEESAPVGALSGSSGVTPTGQARHTVPLDVSPGIRGMTPELAIHYSGGTSNGPLGVGFALSGVSASVQRCAKTQAIDGVSQPFEFERDDALCWGGQRLVLVSGNYGYSGAEYRTRSNPFDKIVQLGEYEERGSTFEIYTKDGRILTLGSAAIADHEIDGERLPWIWAHSLTTDRFGNQIRYRYEKPALDDGEPYALRLSEIAYGGIVGENSRRHVRLEYEERPDASWRYVAGALRGQTHRLSRLVMEGPEAERLATYTLTYDQDALSGQSRLESLQKCDAADACLPATTFEWSAPTGGTLGLKFVSYQYFLEPTAEFLETVTPLVSSPMRMVGDFDGDADHDLVYFTENGWRAWDGTSQSDLLETPVALPWPSSLPDTSPLDTTHPAKAPAIVLSQPGFSMTVLNANGDIRSDFMVPQQPLVDGAAQVDRWGYRFAERVEVYTSTTPEGEEPTEGFSSPIDVMNTWATPAGDPIYAALSLDHNGDGLTDIWMCRGDGYKSGHWQLALNGPQAGGPSGHYAFTVHDSEVGCSVHDELLVTSLRSGTQQLLVIPAFETGPEMPVPSDFDSDEAYREDYLPRPEDERTEYLELSFTPGEGPGTLQSTTLPRDHYQRWHDRNCANRQARHYADRPLVGAGLGMDMQTDINGDGLVDVLRFELASGDDADNPDIFVGLEATATRNETVMCGDEVEDDLPSVLRPYINTGDGYTRGEPLHTFAGNAHANLWLNVRRAQPYDFNLDGIADLLLPSSGDGGDWTVLLSNGDGTFQLHPVSLPEGWPAYRGDEDWTETLTRARAVSTHVMAGSPLTRASLEFMGYVEDYGEQWPFLINTLATTYTEPHNRLTRITDGLGQESKFEYRRISTAGNHGRTGMHTYPLTGSKGAMTVVRRHGVQTNPSGSMEWTHYTYRDAAYDASGQGVLGFATIESTGDGAWPLRTWTRFDYTRNKELGAVPTVGMPVETLEQRGQDANGRVEYWVTRSTQTLETVIEPRLGGSTYFTYPAEQLTEVFVQDTACKSVDCAPHSSDRFQTTRTTQTRDDLGTVTASTTEYSDGNTRTMVVDGLLDDRESWLVGRATSTTTTSCQDEDCASQTKTATYDPVTGAVVQTVTGSDDPTTRLETTLVYNGRGNVTSKTESDGAGDDRTTVTYWDAAGVFPERMDNAAGHTSWVVHDPTSGVVVAEIAADGTTSVHWTDGLLRPTRHEIRPSPLTPSAFAPERVEYLSGRSLHDDTEPSALRVRTRRPDNSQEVIDYGPTRKVMQRSWAGMLPSDLEDPGVRSGDEVYVSTHYDGRGRAVEVSLPTWAPEAPEGYTRMRYDELSRVVETEHPNGTTETVAYQRRFGGMWEWHTDAKGIMRDVQYDPQGRVRWVDDANGTRMCREYGPFDRLIEVRRDCENPGTPWVSTWSYDGLGRVTSEVDPDLGARARFYDNAFGRVVSELDANGAITTSTHDVLGRLVTRTDVDGETTHVYDVEQPGHLEQSVSPDGVRHSYEYDGYGHVAAVRVEDLTGEVPAPLVFEYDYGPSGRLDRLRYPSVDGDPGLEVSYLYDGGGYLRQAQLDSGEVVWSALEADAAGRLTEERLGNGLLTYRGYEPLSGRPTSILTTGAGDVAQQLTYDWHPWGELATRTDLLDGQDETFEYDDLHRLVTATVHRGAVTRPVSMSYDAVGNLTAKSDVGAYVYEADGRLSAYGFAATAVDHDGRGNVVTHGGQTLTYTAFDKPRQLADGAETLSYRYDAEGERFSRHSVADDSWTVSLDGLYERQVIAGGEAELSYRIKAGGRVVATLSCTFDGFDWVDALEYLHDDHLGSTHAVTDEAGDRIRHVAFDPWGRARLGEDWTQSPSDDLLDAMGVGFTGHEARLDAGLINMGGRMYQPQIGRFFSADPVVAAPLDGQAYNRYSYVHNRPLIRVDPTGYAVEEFSPPEGAELSESGEYRVIIVRRPGAGYDELEQWADTLSAMGYNGYGQGGPGISPHSTNPNARRATFSSLPDKYAVIVTPEMCAKFEGCSGKGKPTPIRIWDAPIDEWAKTAVDEATDFVPIVSHAKTVVNAVERIKNGEDVGEVLGEAAVDGVLSLAPGGKVAKKLGKKLGKALDKAGDVADAAGDVKRATKKINHQKQAGHIPGTPQNNNRINQGKPTSSFFGEKSGNRLTELADQRGSPVSGRPNVREYDFGFSVGTGPNGGSMTRVRIHESPKTGEIHGHPSGPERF